jgi:hypothetical protein
MNKLQNLSIGTTDHSRARHTGRWGSRTYLWHCIELPANVNVVVDFVLFLFLFLFHIFSRSFTYKGDSRGR